MRRPPTTNVLIRFRHGLGDAVQLTAVLQHLRQAHPDWQIEVAALVGKHSAFGTLCHAVSILERDPPRLGHIDLEYNLDWDECVTCYADSPSTKAERCLREVFELAPILRLCRYVLEPGKEAFDKAHRYLRQICRTTAGEGGRYPVVLVHYEGNTSPEDKNLPHSLVAELCEHIMASGAVPVILDWDNRSPLPDGKRIHNPHPDLELWGGKGTGDAEAIAALTELCQLMVGVDSGPLHVAGATSTPTIGVWTRHHPLHYFALADNLTHLVPEDHRSLLRGDPDVGEAFFRKHYRYQTYTDLGEALVETVKGRLQDSTGALVYTRNFWIRADNADQDLVVVKDIAEDDSYRVDELPMAEPVVVDVGAHIGCFSQRIHRRNPLARIFAIECCRENMAALRKNVGAFATVIQAAVTYDKDIALLNAVYPNCITTGGTVVLSRTTLEERVARGDVGKTAHDIGDGSYWADFRSVITLTIEDILQSHGLERIDILKLDCEGSEFSILEHTTSLDRIGLIVGEYHGRERFRKLVERRFANWKLRILSDGELGTFWLQHPSGERVGPCSMNGPGSRQSPTMHQERIQTYQPWIYLCTPQHTGTHFVRLLLELHPKVSFWKCARTEVNGRPMGEWQKLHADGEITFPELLRLGICCKPDLPEWSRREAAELGIEIPEKQIEYDLVQKHALRTTYWYPWLPTVVTIRDPLVAVISALRREDPGGPENIIAGLQHTAGKKGQCFYFCVDLWEGQRQQALGLFSYLGLNATQEIHDYLALWPSQNDAERHEHLIHDKSEELAEARRWALERKGVHPAVEPWAEKIRSAGLQAFYEGLGYRDLVWFQ